MLTWLFNYFFVEDEDIKILTEGNPLEDTLERQTIQKALQIIGRYDLAAGKWVILTSILVTIILTTVNLSFQQI